MKVKILFEANGSPETVDAVRCNFHNNYPEFAAEMKNEEYDYNKETGRFRLLWVGDFDESFLGDKNDESLIGYTNRDILLRLTHHAEGFYDLTDAEYVHVEVYVDGAWHGVLPYTIKEGDPCNG